MQMVYVKSVSILFYTVNRCAHLEVVMISYCGVSLLQSLIQRDVAYAVSSLSQALNCKRFLSEE